jgi:phospholipase C
MTRVARVLVTTTLLGCGSGAGAVATTTGDGGGGVEAVVTSTSDGGVSSGNDASSDPASDAAGLGASDAGPDASAIAHVVVIVMENHAFDTYFGRYCTAPPGSAPSCNAGPGCCEAAPATDPSDAGPTTLDDTENAAYDPNHTQACELGEMNDGGMNRYVTGSSCSDPRNFALVAEGDTTVQAYRDYAAQYALADRYFQPIVGQSSSNDMYLAAADYVFTDNAYEPDSNGHGCSLTRTTIEYTGKTTVADVLIAASRTFAFYAEGYAAMLAAPLCPAPPADCALHLPTTPCDYDPGDVPFEYYAQFEDNPAYMKDFGQLATDVAAGTLPDVAFVKALGYHNEHPGYGTTISAGVTFVTSVVSSILASPYASETLILLTWDEGGGFFDHVAPPGTSPVDSQPYGTRIPLLAIGPFAKTNYVSHVVMEHSSIVKFLEWNFTGQTGQLGVRDAVVANIGDMLDPAKTGIAVPAN